MNTTLLHSGEYALKKLSLDVNPEMTMDPAFHHNVTPINIDNLSMFLKTVILTFMVSHFL